MKSKYFSPLFGLTAIAMGFTGMDYSYAVTTTPSDDLYSDSLYIERSSAEVPSSFESSARGHELAQETLTDAGADRALESMADLDDAPAKKVSARKLKKSRKN
jgi:hypothetical protein